MVTLPLFNLSLAGIYNRPHEEKSFISFMREHHLFFTGDEWHL
jgi:hypothetical protein